MRSQSSLKAYPHPQNRKTQGAEIKSHRKSGCMLDREAHQGEDLVKREII